MAMTNKWDQDDEDRAYGVDCGPYVYRPEPTPLPIGRRVQWIGHAGAAREARNDAFNALLNAEALSSRPDRHGTQGEPAAGNYLGPHETAVGRLEKVSAERSLEDRRIDSLAKALEAGHITRAEASHLLAVPSLPSVSQSTPEAVPSTRLDGSIAAEGVDFGVDGSYGAGTSERCAVCDGHWAFDGSKVCTFCSRVGGPRYREPLWLRIARWLAR